MKVFLIVAVADGGVIGRDNALPWRLPADLRRFKRLTLGHHLILGRKTFESIGRPLPGRTTVVVTRQRSYAPQGVRVARSVEEALEIARRAGEEEVFVAGGAEIYRQALPAADRVYLTRVHGRFEGDTFFPELDDDAWLVVSEEKRPADGKNPQALTFLVYETRRDRRERNDEPAQ